MENIELCRLCALEKDNLLSVYGDEGRRLDLESKIKKCLNIELGTKANLPKSVCLDCCSKLESFDEFLESSLSAQTTLCILYTEAKPKDVDGILAGSVDQGKRFDSKDQGNSEEDYDGEFQLEAEDVDLFSKQKSESDDATFPSDEYQDFPSGEEKADRDRSDGSEGSECESKDLQICWLCSDCSDELNSVEDLRLHHLNVHKQEARYMCVHCSKLFLNYRKFLVHLRRHRTGRKYICEDCGKTFSNKKILDNHRLTHSDVRPYVCQECGKSFRQQSALYTHGRCHLPEDIKNKFPCDLCHKRFSTKPNLVTHMRIHSGIRNYTCDQCGKSFIQKGNLDAHLLTHSHDKPFSCEVCNKRFKTGLQLRKHHSVHTGAKPHQCDVCGRTFREKGTLREHHRIHSGVMPFTCEFCGKAFRFKGILTTHRRQHTGERPYSCHECQHHFTNWPNYNKHMKRRHGINTSRSVRSEKPLNSSNESMLIQSVVPHSLPYQEIQTDLYSTGLQSSSTPDSLTESPNIRDPLMDRDPLLDRDPLAEAPLPTYVTYNVYSLSQVATIDPTTTIEIMPPR